MFRRTSRDRRDTDARRRRFPPQNAQRNEPEPELDLDAIVETQPESHSRGIRYYRRLVETQRELLRGVADHRTHSNNRDASTREKPASTTTTTRTTATRPDLAPASTFFRPGSPPPAPVPASTHREWPSLRGWLRPFVSGWFGSTRRIGRDECFLPCPKVAFLTDEAPELTCGLCRDTTIFLTSELDPSRTADTIPCFLPCGHFAGAECMRTWLETNDTCPFCRLPLVHRTCGHRVSERAVSAESLHVLPRTIPDGGRIPDKCAGCLRDDLGRAAMQKFYVLRSEFIDLRRQYEQSRLEDDALLVVHAREAMENVMLEEMHLPQMRAWLSEW